MIEFFGIKRKTAYEMRISDWSSDVCSSDLKPQVFRCWKARKIGLPGDRVPRSDARTLAAITVSPVMIRATNVVADDVAANAEVGAHVLAIGRHDTGYAILPSEDHDATIGQVGPDDLSLRQFQRQRDRKPALVSPRPKITQNRKNVVQGK